MLTGVLLDSRRNIGAKGKFRRFISVCVISGSSGFATAQFFATHFRFTR